MKVLFATRKFDPRNPMPSTHVEFYFHSAFVNNGFEVITVGPFIKYHNRLEKTIKRVYRRLARGGYVKYPLSSVWRVSRDVNRMEKLTNPDLVFAVVPPPFVFYNGRAPCVLRADSLSLTNHQQYPTFGRSALACMAWQDRRALKKCARIITHSDWSKDGLIRDYSVPPEKIVVLPLAAPLASSDVPDHVDVGAKRLVPPYRLLFVGREAYRKGLDVAIEVVDTLNAWGIPAELTVCGLHDKDSAHTHFAGLLRKSDPEQLQRYIGFYRQAHFVLHPARFEPYGQFTSEAAAFGVPVITNDVGGLRAAVTDESGVVLPRGSPPAAYAEIISELVSNSDRYYALCASTRARYERDLTWDVLGKQLAVVLRHVVDARKP